MTTMTIKPPREILTPFLQEERPLRSVHYAFVSCDNSKFYGRKARLAFFVSSAICRE